jgi:hypothetical protein
VGSTRHPSGERETGGGPMGIDGSEKTLGRGRKGKEGGWPWAGWGRGLGLGLFFFFFQILFKQIFKPF